MRIKNKYLRNKAFQIKYWNHIRNKSHPFETFCPYTINIAPHHDWNGYWDATRQIQDHFEWIDKQARAIEKGHKRNFFHAPKHFRQDIWRIRKAQERNVMFKINQGNYDLELPHYKKDADDLWF